MIHSKKILKPLFIAFTIASTITIHPIALFKRSTVIDTTTPIRLSSLNYKSASVLPFYHHKKTKYVILSRESIDGRSIDKGTYDDFSGSKDKEDANFNIPLNKKGKNPAISPARKFSGPIVTAAREFNEEAILQKTIGFDVMQTIDLINKKSQFIISYSQRNGCDRNNPKDPCNVTYITNFNSYAKKFFENFYTARKNAQRHIYKEKDKIAVVAWSSLKNAIIKHEQEKNSFMRRWFGSFLSPQSKTIMIPALELQENTLTFKPAMITLRPYFVKKLKLFFLDKPYKQGMNKRIRHYNE